MGKNHRSLDEILQLPHIAGPVIGLERFHGLRRDRLDAFLHPLGEFLSKVSDQQGNIFRALTQGRHRDRKDLEPVIEVAAKPLLLHHLTKIAIGCGEYADIDAYRPGASQSFELLLLEHAE